MKKKGDYYYLILPLHAIQRIYTHPETAMDDLFCLGVHYLSQSIKRKLTHSLEQVLYCYYREYDQLTEGLKTCLDSLVKKGYTDMDRKDQVFFENTFDVSEIVADLQTYIKSEKDTGFAAMVQEFDRLRTVKKMLGVSFPVPDMIRKIKKLEGYRKEGDALVHVKPDILLDYMQHPKTNYEKDLLACYLGIRSILGNKQYVYTTKDFIACRMIGFKSPAQAERRIKDKRLQQVYETYSKRYQMDKILNRLVDKRFLVKLAVPAHRCIYFSTRLTIEELAEAAFQDIKARSEARRITQRKKLEAALAERLYQKLKEEENK
ncbi:MAG: hypothetical protein LUG51_15320 [Tannerellaceae bacterium]|nr:hypothetical protein [Tannerellaceae bacterium]